MFANREDGAYYARSNIQKLNQQIQTMNFRNWTFPDPLTTPCLVRSNAVLPHHAQQGETILGPADASVSSHHCGIEKGQVVPGMTEAKREDMQETPWSLQTRKKQHKVPEANSKD